MNKILDPKSKNNKNYNLRERLLAFSKRILQLSKELPRTYECEGIRRQLINAGTSIGANFEEADVALTKKDFINKVGISRKEVNETKYWLRVISGHYIEECRVAADIQEIEEIINILSVILIRTKITTKV